MKKIDRRLYLAEDRKTLLEEGDARAAFLWAGAGAEVDNDECERVGYRPNPELAKQATTTAGDDYLVAPDIGQADANPPMTDAQRADLEQAPTKNTSKPADKAMGRPQDKGR